MHDNKTRGEIGWNPQPLDYEIDPQPEAHESQWRVLDWQDGVALVVSAIAFIVGIWGALYYAGGAL